MKPIFATVFSLFLFSLTLNAQDTNKFKVGITFSSFEDNDVIQNSNLDGAPSYSGVGFFTIGINGLKSINNWLEFETGLEYSKHIIQVHPNLPPGADDTPYNKNLSLLTVPISLRANFLKFFFANGGLLLDFDSSLSSPVDSQTGVGCLFGIGAKYDFDFGGSIFINPYAKLHSLISFMPDDYQQRVCESGIRIGFMYNLGCIGNK